MSIETPEWLNTNVIRGFTLERGRAWHYSASLQGAESNHYDGAIPVEDIRRRLFGFTVVPREIYVEIAGVMVAIPDRRAWCASDDGTVLGIHSDTYQGHAFDPWLIGVIEEIAGEVPVANAGLLSNRAVAWVQFEMPENVTTDQGVAFRPSLLATTSFDGSIATTYKRVFTDVVCDNTRAMALAEKGATYKRKHTSRSHLNMGEMREALGILHRMGDEFTAEIATLCGVEISDAQWSAFVQAVAPITDDSTKRSITLAETKRETLTRMWNTDTRVAPWRGTGWGVLQAVNTYAHHESTIRNVATRFERNMMRAVKGEVETLDRGTLAVLRTVLTDSQNNALVSA